MLKRRVGLSFLLSLFLVIGAATADSSNRLDPLLQALYQAQASEGHPEGNIEPSQAITAEGTLAAISSLQGTDEFQGRARLKLNVLFDFFGDESTLAAAGVDVVSKIGSIYGGVVDASRLGELFGIPGLRYVQLSQRLHAQQESLLQADVTGYRELAEPVLLGAAPGEVGSDVLIGFIDTGVDVLHSDFRKANGDTRIKYLLDLSDPGDVDGDGKLDGPDDLGGTLYTEEEVNLILRSSQEIRAKDTTGHGTHGLSIAAGDDPEMPGIAPSSNIIVVKATRKDGSLEFQSSDILGALSFIDHKSAELGMPYVINLSLGTIFASHDGRSLEEIAIDSMTGPHIPGKVVVLAAGNAADNRGTRFRHFSGQAFVGIPSRHTLTLPAYSAPLPGSGNDQILLDLWCEGGDHLTITVTAPDQATKVHAPYGQIVDVATPFGQVFIVNLGGVNPLNGDTEAIVFIYDKDENTPAPGDWEISLTGEEVSESGVYHGWLIDGSEVGGAVPNISRGGDNRYLVAKPGGARNGITVGSFARHQPGTRFLTSWKDVTGRKRLDPSARTEDISGFSSTGRTRDGRIKPEIVAPGEQVIGAVSDDAYPGRSPTSIYDDHPFREIDALIVKREVGRSFGVLQGTSFSAPVVTGIVARLLSVDPHLNAIEVRNILVNRALSDRFTGKVPSDQWGYGKLDLRIAGSPSQASLASRLRIDNNALPDGFVGHTYALALGASGGRLPYSWSIVKGSLPTGLRLSSGSLVAGRPASPGVYTFTVEAKDSSEAQLVARAQFSIAIRELPALSIVDSLAPGRPQEVYSQPVSAEGGVPPYVWSLVAGRLPIGFSFSSDGVLSGMTTEPGRYSFTLRVKDSRSTIALRSLSLQIAYAGNGEWVPLGTATARSVKSIAVDANDSEHLSVVTEDSVFHTSFDIAETTDGGDRWNNISYNSLFSGPIKDIEIDPATSRIWAIDASELPINFDPAARDWKRWSYCGHNQKPSNHDGLTRTDDISFDSVGGIYVYAHNASCPGRPVLSCRQCILRSSDHGETWQIAGEVPFFSPAGQPDNRSSFLNIFRSDPRFMYLGRGFRCGFRFCDYPPEAEQFFFSTTGGATWNQREGNIPTLIVPLVSQTDPLDVLRYGWNRAPYVAGQKFLEKSRDSGLTWEILLSQDLGRICALERSQSNPDIVLAATDNGIFESRDGGDTWAPLRFTGLSFATLYLCEGGAIAIDPKNSDHFWVGAPSAGVYETRDGGATWRRRNNGLFRRALSGIAIRPDAPAELFAVAADAFGGIYLTRNAGERWVNYFTDCGGGYGAIPCSPPDEPAPYSFPMISPRDNGLYLYIDWHGNVLIRSDNHGGTWIVVYPRFAGEAGERFIESIAADPFDENVLLARVSQPTGSGYEGSGIWRSIDRGSNWARVGNAGESPTGGRPRTPWESGMAFASDVEGRAFALGADGLYRSDDKGESWDLVVALPYQAAFVSAVVEPAPSDSRYVFIARGDTVIARDPLAQKTYKTKLADHKIVSLAVDASNPSIAYLGMDFSRVDTTTSINGSGGIWKTTNAGKSWSQLQSFPSNLSVSSLISHPAEGGVLYAATREDGIFKTTDGGQVWSRLDNYAAIGEVNMIMSYRGRYSGATLAATQGFGVQSSGYGNSFSPFPAFGEGNLGGMNVRTLAADVDSEYPEVYAGTDKGLFKYVDDNVPPESWIATGLTDVIVTDIVVDNSGAKPRRIKITTFTGGVAVSEDGGKTFHTYTEGLGSLALTSIENELRGSLSRTWVTMRGKEGVAYSDDGGKTWKPANGNGLRDRNVNDLTIEPPPSRRLWIATDSGVFYSNNSGLSWNELSIGLPTGVPVSSLAMDPNTGEILVSLLSKANGGVYRGGNLNGVWTAINGGLVDLNVRRLTHDGGHSLDTGGRATTFYAATTSGAYSVELRSSELELNIFTDTLGAAVAGQHYESPLSAGGGTRPYSWSIGGGTLPPGLALKKEGLIVGVPIRSGSFSFFVQCTDGNSRTVRKELSIHVQ